MVKHRYLLPPHMFLVDLTMNPMKPRPIVISRQVEVEPGITLIVKGLGISSDSHFWVVAFSNDDGLVGTAVRPTGNFNLDKLSLSNGGSFFVDHVLYELVCDDQSILTTVPKMPSGMLGKQRHRLLRSCKDVVDKRVAMWYTIAQELTTGCEDTLSDESTLPSPDTKTEEKLQLEDVIEYYNPIGVAEDKYWFQTVTVVGINPNDHLVKKIKIVVDEQLVDHPKGRF
jgi:hypothetical protein